MTKGRLAIKGGKPIRKKVLPFVPIEADVTQKEINEVVKVLKSRKLSQLVSEKVSEFEEAFAKYYKIEYAIAVSSGTTALHAALAASGVSPKNDVILPPYTFMATANAILHQGAVPNFSDVNPETYTLDPEDFEKRITPKTKAVIPVHMLGHPADMDPIIEIARKHNLIVIEDCAQANGAEYKGKKVGTFGDFGCFSFYLNKHMTTGGEGGMIITHDEKLAKKVKSIVNHCRVEVSPYPNVPAHNVYWGIGYNYRMTALQAAMGIVQLKRLDKFIEARRKNAEYLTKNLKGIIGIKPPFVSKDVKHVYWAYGALIIEEELGILRDEFAEALLAEGIRAEGYCPIPVHLQDVFKNKVGYGNTTFPFENPLYEEGFSYQKGLCPKAEKLSSQDLLLPVYHSLTKKDLNDIINAIRKIVTNINDLKE